MAGDGSNIARSANTEGQVISESDHILITYVPACNWIYANWFGEQTEKHIRRGGNQMVTALRTMHSRYGCTKVLNDNREVHGVWGHSVQWAAEDWFPRMINAGLTRFAWILSPSAITNMAGTRVRIRSGEPAVQVFKTFSDELSAVAWLRDG